MWSRIGVFGLIAAVAAVLAANLFASPAGAIHEVVIEFTVVRGEPNSIVEVERQDVEPWLQGESCEVTVEIVNNSSVHLGTDLLIASGGDSVTISDVETKAGVITFREGELILGDDVVVSVHLGPDGTMSGGISIDFDCDQPPPATTQPPTTTAPPPSVLPETTTAPTTEQPQPSVLPQTTVPRAEPETPTAAQPAYTG
jgi:hypothetical protein